MSSLRASALCLILSGVLFATARAQAPWADARYMNRVDFTVTNPSTHSYSPGDVVTATIPYSVISNRIKPDGSDAVVYFAGAPLPCRALPMGGSVKVIVPLQAALGIDEEQPGYTLYFNALQNVAPPPLPDGVQGWDFGDGAIHGWQSLQDPAGAPDVKIGTDSTYGSALVMDNSKYHHPIAWAAGMTPVGESTTYTKLRTGGDQNEAAAFQRFNTQTLTDTLGTPYLTGSSVAGTGLAIDAFGSQEMAITVGLGGAEGAGSRVHPGPGALDPGMSYMAFPEYFQYIVTATTDSFGATTAYGDAWEAPAGGSGGPADPLASGFKIQRDTSATETVQPLAAGKVGIMSYYSTLYLHWMYSVPGGWAEFVGATYGAVETSSGPGPGKAIVQGVAYYQPYGTTAALGGLAITIRDTTNAVLASGTCGAAGDYRLMIDAGVAASSITVTATGAGMTGSAAASVIENTGNTVNVPVNFTSQVNGTVYDVDGTPQPGVAVGRPLDGLPWVYTDANGRYTLPSPGGTTVAGAHADGCYLSGPRWITGTKADFTLLPAASDLLQSITPAVTPSGMQGTNIGAVSDGALTTAWTSGSVTDISTSNPLRITFPLNNATVAEIDVHWKHFPAAWHVEMTNSGGTRTYYSAGDPGPNEIGGYVAPGSADRHVIPVKTARVVGVTSVAIVITGTYDADPLSLYEVIARPDNPATIADAAAAMRIAAGFQSSPKDNNAFYRWNAFNDDATINFLDAVTLARDLGRQVQPLRVLVINYQPRIESRGGIYVRQVYGWPNPYTNTENHRRDMELASHDYLRINLLPQIEVDEYPLFLDGTRYDDASYIADTNAHTWNRPGIDYNAIISEFDLVRRVDCGDVDEVWVQAVPGFGMWETTMAGPNAYFCNSGPVPGTNGNRLFIITGFNYERGNDVMLEDWGHRSESILRWVYGYWDSASERTTWDRFTRYDMIAPGRASCGNVHFPPNGVADYDYGNTTLVSSDADDWLNYPNFTGARTLVNRANWAGPYAGDYHRNYHIWWFQRMPHVSGLGPDGYQANWWKYIVDMNSYPETR